MMFLFCSEERPFSTFTTLHTLSICSPSYLNKVLADCERVGHASGFGSLSSRGFNYLGYPELGYIREQESKKKTGKRREVVGEARKNSHKKIIGERISRIKN